MSLPPKAAAPIVPQEVFTWLVIRLETAARHLHGCFRGGRGEGGLFMAPPPRCRKFPCRDVFLSVSLYRPTINS